MSLEVGASLVGPLVADLAQGLLEDRVDVLPAGGRERGVGQARRRGATALWHTSSPPTGDPWRGQLVPAS
jgi:hypothetical protein